MKTKYLQFVTLAASTVAATVLLSLDATAADGYKQADKTGKYIAEFRDDIVSIKNEVDASLAALDKVSEQATVDPRKAFKDFDKSVPRVDSAAMTAKKHAEKMRAEGKEYFTKWEKDLASVNDPEIRKLAEERKAKLQVAFGDIKKSTEPARDQFIPWLEDLKDLQKYLSNDLTIGGIDAAKDLIAKTKSDGRAVQQSLDKVIAELNTVVATITPAKKK
jgi:hypothetical protein